MRENNKSEKRDIMNIYALSSLLSSYVVFILGVLIYRENPKNELNRIYMLACALLGYLAVLEFGMRQAADLSTVYMFLRMGFVWPFIVAIYTHFTLIFTKKTKLLQKKVTYILIYGPALIFAVLELTTDSLTGTPVKEYWGWNYGIPEDSLIYDINSLWFFSLALLPLILVSDYIYKVKDPVEKKRAEYVLTAMLLPAVVVLISEGPLSATDFTIPELTITATAAEVALIAYGIHRYNIFELTPEAAAEDIITAMSNLLFLVRKDGTISRVNHSALHLLGYSESELVGQPMKSIFTEEWENTENLQTLPGPYSREMTITAKDGSLIPVLLSLSAVRDKDGRNLGMLCVGSDLRDHLKAEEAHKKEILLKEIHHRVKNNMQIISSLLSLQSKYIADERYSQMFKESQYRIQSMALIHEKLYKSKDLVNVDSREYFADLVQSVMRSYRGMHIALTLEIDRIPLGIDAAIPCGLIINELVTNSLKHAFPDGNGEVRVRFSARDDSLELVVADNGVGIPDDVDFRNTETLGLRLVTILAEDQLKGNIALARKEGTEFCIIFSEKGRNNR